MNDVFARYEYVHSAVTTSLVHLPTDLTAVGEDAGWGAVQVEDLEAVVTDRGALKVVTGKEVLRVVINKEVLRAEAEKGHLVMVKEGLATLEVVWEEALEEAATMEAATMVAATMVVDRYAPEIHHTHNACQTAFIPEPTQCMQPSYQLSANTHTSRTTIF